MSIAYGIREGVIECHKAYFCSWLEKWDENHFLLSDRIMACDLPWEKQRFCFKICLIFDTQKLLSQIINGDARVFLQYIFFESIIYYTVLDRSPWQHYFKSTIYYTGLDGRPW